MQLNQEQYEIFEAVKRFIASDDGQIFVIKGYAGTGKTTMIKQITDNLSQNRREFRLMAPTGRAASVLRKKTGYVATTIHRGIYNFFDIQTRVEKDDIANSTYKIIFPILQTENPQVCIVDESSMISNHESTNELWQFGTECLLNDLLTFTFMHKEGKLILLGDPAQLPPVGEAQSEALDEEILRIRGYKVESYTLTQIMRQDKESGILANAMQVRDAYESNTVNSLQITYSDDVIKLSSDQIVETYLQHFPTPQLGNSVVISYSNGYANLYNQDIRRRMYGYDIQYPHKGDIVMVVSNHYDRNEEMGHIPVDIMNGEFAQIIETGHIVKQSAPVKENGEKKLVELEFMHTTLLLGDGTIWEGKIIVNPLLNDEQRNLSVTQLKALFINFCMRHPKLDDKKNHAAFIDAYQKDEYVTALRVKYGYAITCHKSQGGEWDTVFVNAEGIYVHSFGLRWLYTALTRARKKLYCVNAPSVSPTSKLRINDITQVSHRCVEYPSPLQAEDGPTPFHDCNADSFLKAKYHCVVKQLAGSGYSVQNIKSLPYRERYFILAPDSRLVMVDFVYSSRGVFNPANSNDPTLLNLLNASEQYPPLIYEPTSQVAQFLFDFLLLACAACGVTIVGVTEELTQYKIVYCLQTSGRYAWLNVFVNDKGFITYIAPYSDCREDEKLIKLLDYLRNLTV